MQDHIEFGRSILNSQESDPFAFLLLRSPMDSAGAEKLTWSQNLSIRAVRILRQAIGMTYPRDPQAAVRHRQIRGNIADGPMGKCIGGVRALGHFCSGTRHGDIIYMDEDDGGDLPGSRIATAEATQILHMWAIFIYPQAVRRSHIQPEWGVIGSIQRAIAPKTRTERSAAFGGISTI